MHIIPILYSGCSMFDLRYDIMYYINPGSEFWYDMFWPIIYLFILCLFICMKSNLSIHLLIVPLHMVFPPVATQEEIYRGPLR